MTTSNGYQSLGSPVDSSVGVAHDRRCGVSALHARADGWKNRVAMVWRLGRRVDCVSCVLSGRAVPGIPLRAMAVPALARLAGPCSRNAAHGEFAVAPDSARTSMETVGA